MYKTQIFMNNIHYSYQRILLEIKVSKQICPKFKSNRNTTIMGCPAVSSPTHNDSDIFFYCKLLLDEGRGPWFAVVMSSSTNAPLVLFIGTVSTGV
jgi:hypothetical protein